MLIITKSSQDDKFLEIATISNTHKLDGEIKVKSFSDELEKYEKIYIKEKGVYIELDIELVSKSGDIYIANILGVETLEEAQKYKKKMLYISKEELEELEDEYYVKDVLNSKCYDENDDYLGKIVDVMLDTKIEIFVLDTGKKEICIPNMEEYIISMDIKNKICKFNVESLRSIF